MHTPPPQGTLITVQKTKLSLTKLLENFFLGTEVPNYCAKSKVQGSFVTSQSLRGGRGVVQFSHNIKIIGTIFVAEVPREASKLSFSLGLGSLILLVHTKILQVLSITMKHVFFEYSFFPVAIILWIGFSPKYSSNLLDILVELCLQ